MDSVMQLDLIL